MKVDRTLNVRSVHVSLCFVSVSVFVFSGCCFCVFVFLSRCGGVGCVLFRLGPENGEVVGCSPHPGSNAPWPAADFAAA